MERRMVLPYFRWQVVISAASWGQLRRLVPGKVDVPGKGGSAVR